MSKGILITGGTQGIGLGIAKYYAARGFHCFLNYLSNEPAAVDASQAIGNSGGLATTIMGDVRDEQNVLRMYDLVRDSGVSLETLVINAVDEVPKGIDEASFSEWHQVLLTKLDGAFLSLKYALPLLAEADNPAVIFITSADGWRPDGSYIGYQVGTAGLIAMAIGNAQYLGKKYRVRVNAVAPGPVRSGLWAKAGETEEMWEAFAARNPTGRVATPEDVARAVWFLAEDPLKFLNGTTINVDGGSQWL